MAVLWYVVVFVLLMLNSVECKAVTCFELCKTCESATGSVIEYSPTTWAPRAWFLVSDRTTIIGSPWIFDIGRCYFFLFPSVPAGNRSLATCAARWALYHWTTGILTPTKTCCLSYALKINKKYLLIDKYPNLGTWAIKIAQLLWKTDFWRKHTSIFFWNFTEYVAEPASLQCK